MPLFESVSSIPVFPVKSGIAGTFYIDKTSEWRTTFGVPLYAAFCIDEQALMQIN